MTQGTSKVTSRQNHRMRPERPTDRERVIERGMLAPAPYTEILRWHTRRKAPWSVPARSKTPRASPAEPAPSMPCAAWEIRHRRRLKRLGGPLTTRRRARLRRPRARPGSTPAPDPSLRPGRPGRQSRRPRRRTAPSPQRPTLPRSPPDPDRPSQARAQGASHRRAAPPAIILITHNEIHAQLVADRYTFLSLGQVIGNGVAEDLGGEDIRRLMAGGARMADLEDELAAIA